MKRSSIIFLIFVALVILGVFLVSSLIKPDSDEDFARCISSKTTLYVSTGCTACAHQESLFGDTLKYLNVVDCALEPEKCSDIYAVPTWKFNGQKEAGVKSLDELKELTGC